MRICSVSTLQDASVVLSHTVPDNIGRAKVIYSAHLVLKMVLLVINFCQKAFVACQGFGPFNVLFDR